MNNDLDGVSEGRALALSWKRHLLELFKIVLDQELFNLSVINFSFP